LAVDIRFFIIDIVKLISHMLSQMSATVFCIYCKAYFAGMLLKYASSVGMLTCCN